MPLLKEKKPPPARAVANRSVYFDRVHGWVRWARKKRKPSKTVQEFKRNFHDAVEYFKDEIKAGLS